MRSIKSKSYFSLLFSDIIHFLTFKPTGISLCRSKPPNLHVPNPLHRRRRLLVPSFGKDQEVIRLLSQTRQLIIQQHLILNIVVSVVIVSKHSEKKPSLWKKPVIVKGPLGIISWIELAFLTMFGTLLVWSFASYIHSMFPSAPYEADQSRIKPWEAKLESSALLLGLVGHICLAFLFFPVTRASSILRLIGLTSEASIKYHIWIGHTAMTLFTAHGVCYIIFWADTHQISQVKNRSASTEFPFEWW